MLVWKLSDLILCIQLLYFVTFSEKNLTVCFPDSNGSVGTPLKHWINSFSGNHTYMKMSYHITASIHYWVFLSSLAAGVAAAAAAEARLRPLNMTIIADGNATVISVALMKWEMRWIDTEANRTSRTQQTYATAPITLVSSLQCNAINHTSTSLELHRVLFPWYLGQISGFIWFC